MTSTVRPAAPVTEDKPVAEDETAQRLRVALAQPPTPAGGGYAVPPPAAPAGPAAADVLVRSGSALTVGEAWAVFDAQATARQLDAAARWMQKAGRGYYTIGSSGHEANAVVAGVLRPSDPALLHYRSGGFYVRRARQVPGIDPVADVLAGVAAAADEPIAGGRHKVFGRRELAIIPQTSTIASHLPRAVGVAFAIERARKLGVASAWPADAIAVTSLGDASMNHSTAVGALNTAGYSAYQGLPLPLLVVCEDNGIGISVRTPGGWIAANWSHRPGLDYFFADGADTAAVYDAALAAADYVRRKRRPALLHLSVVRYGGHAGSDVESAYRTPAEIHADLDRDPIIGTARQLVACGGAAPAELLDRYAAIAARVHATARETLTRPALDSRAAVVAPLAPHRPALVAARVAGATTAATVPGAAGERDGGVPPSAPPAGPLTLAQSINAALAESLADYPQMAVFGEDVGRKGGVYGVTRGLAARFGRARVFDTPLDEQSILGLALGMGVTGMLPVPEIQYLAYLHNAEDQLRGEAASLQFFSTGQYRNPMVLRIAGYAYQRGFGGHFHNDNGLAVLRDIPGLVIASPCRGDDAAAMLRTCLASALVDGTVCVFLEPIALYHTRDLHGEGDSGWLFDFPAPGAEVPIGSAHCYGEGTDLTILTFGNGVPMSLRVAKTLAAEGISARILDLRWLNPLPVADMLTTAQATKAVLVVDETRHSGGIGEGIVAELVAAGYDRPIHRIAAADSFIPLGAAANLVLVTEDEILTAARCAARG